MKSQKLSGKPVISLALPLTAALLCAASALLQGCGKDSAATVGEQVAQQKDRDRAQANAQMHEVAPLTGDYTSTGFRPVDASFTGRGVLRDGKLTERFDITANLAVDYEDTGASTPQPTVNGAFIMLDHGRLDKAGNPTRVVCPIASSKYDSHLNSLVLHLNNAQTGSQAARVDCKVIAVGRLDCTWLSYIGETHFKFLLSKQ